MAAQRVHRAYELFVDLINIPASRRTDALLERCGDDEELRHLVEGMIADAAESPETVVPPRRPVTGALPEAIGGYRIKGVVASGGMGTVFLAHQEQPRRAVALKVIKSGVTSPSALRRFEYESQVLARLQHPGIAQVYEAGTHDDGTGGVPFFALEYVAGASPITEYARAKSLDLADRLELFLDVCDAVHHGHQRGIIHRDLKPANILVGADGHPKIIDFGVARATDADMAATTLQTDVGQLVGTLQYMSPEQCEADPHALDVRSDVYALGVVLYELLCERLPYDVSEVAIYEATQVIRETAPTRPSTVNRVLRGDIEIITLKTLEKDRDRRYQSVTDLAADIRRYLDNEPITAHAPSALYRLRKAARRHRAASLACAAVVIGIAVAFVGLASGLVRATRAEEVAGAERDIAEAVSEFLNEDLLSQASPGLSTSDVLLRDVLDVAASSVGRRFTDRPLVEARVRETIGTAYLRLGELEKAEDHLSVSLSLFDRERGAEHRDTLRVTSTRGTLLQQQDLRTEAEAVFLRILPVATRELGEADPDTLSIRANLGDLYRLERRYEESEQHLGPALAVARRELGDTHEQTRRLMSNLASTFGFTARYDEAESLYREHLETLDELNLADSPESLVVRNNLANMYFRVGRRKEAADMFAELLESRKRVYGPRHIATARAINAYGSVLESMNEYADAAAMMREALDIRTEKLGAEHRDTLLTKKNLAIVRLRAGHADEALAIIEDVVETRRRIEPGSAGLVKTLIAHAQVLTALERFDEAADILMEAIDIGEATVGPDHDLTINTRSSLGRTLRIAGRLEEADRVYAVAVASVRRSHDPSEEIWGRLHAFHGRVVAMLGRHDEAEELLLAAHEASLAHFSPEHPMTKATIRYLAHLYTLAGRPEEAARYEAMQAP